MTIVNDYYWLLPHEITAQDPPEIGLLQEYFYWPVMNQAGPALSELGYSPALCDILIPPDTEVLMAQMRHVFRVNIRFTKTLSPDTFARFHIEHHDWHHMAPNKDHHTFSVYFDTFRFIDPAIRRLDENWEGRLHMRISELPGRIAASDDEEPWSADSPEDLATAIGKLRIKLPEIDSRASRR